jgi:hypothetical protein
MKIPAELDGIRHPPLPNLQSGAAKIVEDQATEHARSSPLTSTYNSTFIVLVLSIAIILALILVFWPSGKF